MTPQEREELRKQLRDISPTVSIWNGHRCFVLPEDEALAIIRSQREEEVNSFAESMRKLLSPVMEIREVYCPKEDKHIKEYFSHHDLDHYCEDCGTRLKERTVMVNDSSFNPYPFEVIEMLDQLLAERYGKGEDGTA